MGCNGDEIECGEFNVYSLLFGCMMTTMYECLE